MGIDGRMSDGITKASEMGHVCIHSSRRAMHLPERGSVEYTSIFVFVQSGPVWFGLVHTSWSSPLFGAAAATAATMICRRAGARVYNGGGKETETTAFVDDENTAADGGGGSGSGPPGGGSGVQGTPEGVRYAALGGLGEAAGGSCGCDGGL